MRRKCGVFPNRTATHLRSARRKARRGSHGDRRFGFVLTTRPSPVLREAALDQRVKLVGFARARRSPRFARIDGGSGCAELGADANVPEGDASDSQSRKGSGPTPKRQRSIRVSGKALPAHEARRVGRRVREDACIETNRSKQIAANPASVLPGSNHANG